MLNYFYILCSSLFLLALSPAMAEDLSQPLSQADAEHYRIIFDAQEKSDWKTADRHIKQLEDKILLGHALHQRYMHPTGWRSSFKELSSWLRYYKDHPQAEEIYRLARKRRPRGASLQRYQPRRWRLQDEDPLHPTLVAEYENTGKKESLRRIEGKVRYHSREDEPTQALNYINHPRQRSLMTKAQYNRMRSWIAESYYYNEKISKAKMIAEEVARQTGDSAPMAYWIAGLINFRQGNYEAASDYFAAQAALPWQQDNLRAGAGFWAARSALAAGKTDLIIPNLEIAAQKPFTFYGQLALAQLGQKAPFNWEQTPITQADWQKLYDASPRIRRAAALAQIGEIDRAQQELRWAHGELTADDDVRLIAAAEALALPSAQVTMALASGGKSTPGSFLDAALYPLPPYAPNGGYTIDRAVLFGLIRQESKFMTKANSHAGAKGLMQLMPRTAAYVAKDRSLRYRSQGKRLFDPAYNMQLGQSYVEYLLDRQAGGDLFEMALSYNWGPGNLRRFKNKTGITDQLLLLESIPNPEARNFVEQVMSNIWVYRARLGQEAPSRDAVAGGGKPIYRAIDY